MYTHAAGGLILPPPPSPKSWYGRKRESGTIWVSSRLLRRGKRGGPLTCTVEDARPRRFSQKKIHYDFFSIFSSFSCAMHWAMERVLLAARAKNWEKEGEKGRKEKCIFHLIGNPFSGAEISKFGGDIHCERTRGRSINRNRSKSSLSLSQINHGKRTCQIRGPGVFLPYKTRPSHFANSDSEGREEGEAH